MDQVVGSNCSSNVVEVAAVNVVKKVGNTITNDNNQKKNSVYQSQNIYMLNFLSWNLCKFKKNRDQKPQI